MSEFDNNRFERMNQLRLDNILVDFVVKNKGRDCNAHKIVLAAASGYFRQILERDQTVSHVRIDFDNATVEYILGYIYSGDSALTNDNVEEVIRIAKFLVMQILLYDCYMFIEAQGELCPLRHLIDDYEIDVDYAAIVLEIAATPAYVLVPGSIHQFVFDRTPYRRVRELLTSDQLGGGEYGRVAFIVQWVILDYGERMCHAVSLLSTIQLKKCSAVEMLKRPRVDTGYNDLDLIVKRINVVIKILADSSVTELAKEYLVDSLESFDIIINR